MSDSNADTGDCDAETDKTPEEIAYAAVEQAEEIADKDADGLMEQAKRDQTASDVLIDGLAQAVRAGFDRDSCETILGGFADKVRQVTKTQLKEKLSDAVAGEMTSSDGPARMTNQLLVDKCDLTATMTTDHDQETTYRWDFGDFHVKSKGSGGSERHHLSEYQFRTEILSSRGRIPRSTGWDGDEWVAFVSDYIHNNATTTEVNGVLTSACQALSNHIETHTAYAPIEVLDVLEGVFIPTNDGPTDGDESEVWVPNTVIMDIADRFNIESVAKLYAELDARDALADRLDAASVTKRIAGKRQTYWVLDRDFAEPLGHEINPEGLSDPSEYTEGTTDPLDMDSKDEQDDTTEDDSQ